MTDVDRSERPTPPRAYRQSARARSVGATRDRILDATEALLREATAPAISLGTVAREADVTIPTLLRHFGSKDALVAAALAAALVRIRAARPRVALGDHLGAARALAEEHERHASLLRAAGALPASAQRELEGARRLHRDWLARTFARSLSPLPPVVHRRRLAQLVAVSGPAPWRALRETERLGAGQAEAALAELLRALTR